MHYYSAIHRYDSAQEHIDKMDLMNDLAKKYDEKLDGNVFAMSFAYSNYVLMQVRRRTHVVATCNLLRILQVITSELMRNIGLALLCVFLATLFLIADLVASLMVVSSVCLALVDVAGFMYFWGLSIDTIAAILLTIALGLAVDYSAHIAHSFMVKYFEVSMGTKSVLLFTG